MRYRSESDKRTAPPAPTCWHREPSCSCLRIELSGTEAHVLPYQHLVIASLTRKDGADVLRLIFSNHDVEIIGHNLRELLAATQDFAVKWLRAVPERYHSMAGAESSFISSIHITGPVE